MKDHKHRWHVEQQTNHRFCEMCGKHKPSDPNCQDRPSALWSYLTVRPWSPPVGSGSTTSAPWCSICAGWHIPGQGACTATYSGTPR